MNDVRQASEEAVAMEASMGLMRWWVFGVGVPDERGEDGDGEWQAMAV